MQCHYCQSDNAKRSGTYSTTREQYRQRWFCGSCGKTWTEGGKSMNRLSPQREEVLVKTLRSGVGIRAAARQLGFCQMTCVHVAKRHGIKFVRKKSDRDRTDYLKQYESKMQMSQYKRLNMRDKIHGCVALWLAKLDKPQTLGKIHAAMLVQFPELSFVSLKQMVEHNAWGCYKRTPQGKVEFNPPMFFNPYCGNPENTKYPEMTAARAVYLERRRITDPFTNIFLQSKTHRKEIEQKRAVHQARRQIQMLSTAIAISQHYEKL